MTQNPAQHYLAAFRARLACCQALMQLTQQQQTHIDEADYSGLVSLLARKQQLLDQLSSHGPGGSELWQDWRNDRESLSGTDRQVCEQLLDNTSEFLRQLQFLEAEATNQMACRREETRSALAEVNLGGRAIQGYQTPVESVVSRRLDLDL